MIIRVFTFLNELDILEFQLSEIYNIVDYIVIIEGDLTHTGLTKQFFFEEHKSRYDKYMNKIIYIKINLPQNSKDLNEELEKLNKNIEHQIPEILLLEWKQKSWERDIYPKIKGLSKLLQQIKNIDLTDYILMGDIDEIIGREAINQLHNIDDEYIYGFKVDKGNWYKCQLEKYVDSELNCATCYFKLNRIISLLEFNFDWENYIENNMDLKKNNIDTELKVYEHYIHNGIKEHREYNKCTTVSTNFVDYQIKIFTDNFDKFRRYKSNTIFKGYEKIIKHCDIYHLSYFKDSTEECIKCKSLADCTVTYNNNDLNIYKLRIHNKDIPNNSFYNSYDIFKKDNTDSLLKWSTNFKIPLSIYNHPRIKNFCLDKTDNNITNTNQNQNINYLELLDTGTISNNNPVCRELHIYKFDTLMKYLYYFEWNHRLEAHKTIQELHNYYNIENNWKKLIKPGDTVIDIGAHTGDTTIAMSILSSGYGTVQSKILAIEPNIHLHSILKLNLNINLNISQFIFCPLLVTTTSVDKIKYYDHNNSMCNGAIIDNTLSDEYNTHYPKNKYLLLKGTTLDQICRDYLDHTDSIDFIKIDCVGHDKAILKSSKILLEKHKPNIFIDWSMYFNKSDSLDLFKTISEMDYIPYNPYTLKVTCSENYSENLILIHKTKKYYNV